jgi:hypothetical protein
MSQTLEDATRRVMHARKKSKTADRGGTDDATPLRAITKYRPFPLEILPLTLRDYVGAASAAIGCDPALVALPALATAMSCIGNSRAIQLRRGWSEPAVLWAITIARSGSAKSPGFSAAVDSLLEFQMDRWDQFQREKAEAKNRDEQAPLAPPCLVTSDATIEAVGELLRDNPRGLLLARDELDGWFQSFTKHRRGDSSDRPAWLELHSARTLRLDRITRERGALAVRRACCSLCGTIQPAVLARALNPEALGAGLGARFLLAMPPVKKRVWTEAQVAVDLAEQYGDLLRRLLALPLADQTKRKPHFLELSSDAKAIWVSWFDGWGERQYNATDEQAAVLSKLESYAARLALLHHVASHVAVDTDDLRSIGEQSIRAGITLAEWFATEAERVYAMLHEKEADRFRRELVDWIAARGGETTAKAVQDNQRSRYPTADDAKAALDELAATGIGEWLHGTSGPRGGRPSNRLRLRARETSKPSAIPQKAAGNQVVGRFRGIAGAGSDIGEAYRDPGEEG